MCLEVIARVRLGQTAFSIIHGVVVARPGASPVRRASYCTRPAGALCSLGRRNDSVFCFDLPHSVLFVVKDTRVTMELRHCFIQRPACSRSVPSGSISESVRQTTRSSSGVAS